MSHPPGAPPTWRSRIGGTLLMLHEALGRVSAEYKDLAREQQGDQDAYTVLLYLAPLTRGEFERVRDAMMRNERIPEVGDMPTKPPRNAGAVMLTTDAPTADAALARALRAIRQAAQLADVTISELRVEVLRAEEAVA